MTYKLEHLTAMRGASVYSVDGDKIGKVDEVYVDEQTEQPQWIGLGKAEQVDVPVELRRDKARVTREPVAEGMSDREMGEDSIEVTLREEQPVVEKQAVAKERIAIEKEVETETEMVSDELRKERVDVDEENVRR